MKIDEYFLNLIKNDPVLQNFENDLGLILLANSLAYKIEQTQEIITDEIRESYNPQTEVALLAYLAHKVGYLRLKKPLQIQGTVVSNDYVLLKKDTRFTDGKNLYYLNDDTICNAGEEVKAYFTLMEKTVKNVSVDSGTLFFHINTGYTYKDLFDVKVYKNGQELKYSQNFIDETADYSLEIKTDGYIGIAIMLNNENGLNIQKNDILEVELYTTPDVKEPPTGITIIENGYNLVVKDISIYKNYAPPMSLQEMEDMIRFGRKSLGDLIMNEDYYQFIMKKFADEIEILKVWQEKEQNEESGYSILNTNKVFMAYLTKDLKTYDADLSQRIIKELESAIYGKYFTIQESYIKDIYVNVSIKTTESYSSMIEEQIKNLIAGYYDDLRKKLTKETLFSKVFEYLQTQIKNFSLIIDISEKGVYVNRKIYRIRPENIIISISGL